MEGFEKVKAKATGDGSSNFDYECRSDIIAEGPQLQHVVSIANGAVQDLAIEGQPAKLQFNKWNIIAFAFVICNSWAGVAGSIQLALLQGGPATLLYR